MTTRVLIAGICATTFIALSGCGGGSKNSQCSLPTVWTSSACGTCVDTACDQTFQTACAGFSSCYCSCISGAGATAASCTSSCASSSCTSSVGACALQSIDQGGACASVCGTSGAAGSTGTGGTGGSAGRPGSGGAGGSGGVGGTGGMAGAGGAGGAAGGGGKAGAGGAAGGGGGAAGTGGGVAGKSGKDAAVDFAVNAGTCAAVSLLANCSFELPVVTPGTYSNYTFVGDGGFGGWSVAGAAGNVDLISTTFTQNGISFEAEDGQQSMDLTGTSNSATGVAQTVTTVQGTRYTLSFWVGNVINTGGIFGTTSTVNVLIDGRQVLAAENSAGNGTMLTWQQFSVEFVAASTATTISLINGDPSSDTSNFVDNVILAVAAAQ